MAENRSGFEKLGNMYNSLIDIDWGNSWICVAFAQLVGFIINSFLSKYYSRASANPERCATNGITALKYDKPTQPIYPATHLESTTGAVRITLVW